MCRVTVSYSQPIRFVRTDHLEHAQSDGKFVNRGLFGVILFQKLRFLVLTKRSAASGDENGALPLSRDSRFVLASLSPLFAETTQKTCSAGYVFRAMEKEKITFIKSVIVINLQILLLEYIFCNFILLVICRDFISHTILRNVNTGIKKLLL